ncbi:PAS domain-containing hybrid sensor histidine kinase/response regulator [Ghiorsea bivora]|uniref:PAS domain-containing hybrid sensor histidine kinase/response regulator n=1 Tax=Ghiorsea bivora TaxID=1485545 RepID=UPI000691BF58|nr:PAS domain-containing sensor histidine kinase [Ghiorsea bivora]
MKSLMCFDVLQTLPDGVCIVDKDYKIVFWNKRLVQWSQQAESVFVGQKLTDLYPRLAGLAYKTRIDQVLHNGSPAFFSMLLHHHLFDFQKPDGSLQAQRVTVTSLRNDNETLALFTVVDMTRSVLREEKHKKVLASYEHEIEQRKQLEQQNNILVRAVDKAAEAFVIMRIHGDIEYVNKAFLAQTGCLSSEHVLGESYWDTYIMPLEDNLNLTVKQVVSGAETWQGRLEIKRKDDSCFMASVSIAPIVNPQGKVTHAVVVQEDISEQLKFEMQYRQSEKQEALATLIGGIAHDFNNLLSGMLGHLYLANREVKDMPKTSVRLGKIQGVANDIAGIVQQLMTFARKGEVKKRRFPLGSFIKEFIRLAEHTVPDNIKLSIDFQRADFSCQGDVESLQEALLNIIQNAVDAAVDTREPTIILGLQSWDADNDSLWVKKHAALAEGRFAHITIADNGSGIKDEDIHKVFDPFFTTKTLGSGLGLAVAIGNIKNNHGMIDIESKPDGTVVHIWLPLLEDKKSEEIHSILPRETMNQTILLVDDDGLVRDTCAELLDVLGYQILQAEDGQCAVDMMREHGDQVDLIVMDMVMPRLVGTAAASQIRQLYPDVPIIFATAYDQSISIKATKDFAHSMLMSKPFHPDTLQENIEAFLY